MTFGAVLQAFTLAAPALTLRRQVILRQPQAQRAPVVFFHRRTAAAANVPATVPRRPGPMSRGELYEYYKRIGMLEVYFGLFPCG